MPDPIWETLIDPPITLLNALPCVIVSERLNASVPPAEPVIALDVASEPAVPPEPICSVPALMLVVPV